MLNTLKKMIKEKEKQQGEKLKGLKSKQGIF